MNMDENINRAMCVDLVRSIHNAMNWDVWGKKRLTYWSILSDNIAAAAYTSSLAKWLNNICNAMDVRAVGRNDGERISVEKLINSGNDKQILKSFREETGIIVLLLRNEIDAATKQKNTQQDLFQ